jgi:membrane protein implicated in regulation of membrane protease activity
MQKTLIQKFVIGIAALISAIILQLTGYWSLAFLLLAFFSMINVTVVFQMFENDEPTKP